MCTAYEMSKRSTGQRIDYMTEKMLLATATSLLYSDTLFRKCSKNKGRRIQCKQSFSYCLSKTYWLLRNANFFLFRKKKVLKFVFHVAEFILEVLAKNVLSHDIYANEMKSNQRGNILTFQFS